MFSRHDVCALTGIPVERFKSMARRNQLPTVHAEPPRGATEASQDRAKERGWNWFSPIDVLLIAVQERLMTQFGYAAGFDTATAAQIVIRNAGDIGRIFWLASPTIDEPSPHDLWVGYLGHTDPLTGRCSQISGTLSRVLEIAGADTQRGHARLVLVNVSEVLRDVRGSADHFKITYPVPANWA